MLAVQHFSFDLVIPVPISLLHVYTVYLYVDGKMLQCSTWCAKLCIIFCCCAEVKGLVAKSVFDLENEQTWLNGKLGILTLYHI